MALRTLTLNHDRWIQYVNGELDETRAEEFKVDALLVKHILQIYLRDAEFAIRLLASIEPEERPVQYRALLGRWRQIKTLIWQAFWNSTSKESQERLRQEMETL